jgi:hypothetical protein
MNYLSIDEKTFFMSVFNLLGIESTTYCSLGHLFNFCHLKEYESKADMPKACLHSQLLSCATVAKW